MRSIYRTHLKITTTVTDSIHTVQQHIVTGPTEHISEPVNPLAEQQAAADIQMMQQALKASSSPNTAQSKPRQQQMSAAATTLPKDTVSIDTAAHAATPGYSIHMDRPSQEEHFAKSTAANIIDTDIASWIISGVVILFLLISFRFRNNFKYIRNLLHETVDSARRRNMFQDTMRETTFLTLLILLTIGGSGLLLCSGVSYCSGSPSAANGEFPSNLWYYLALTGGYFVAQWIAYICIGNTFTTPGDASRWLQGFKAGTALMGPILLPLALLGSFYPAALPYTLISALFIYFLSRLLFIFKGMRIFSARSTYFLLFLYYLCSVEIVPVLLIWQLALSPL